MDKSTAKMNSILLLNPPQTVYNKKNIWSAIRESSLPIGLAQLAAFIRANGFKVEIIDLCVEEFSEEEFRSSGEEKKGFPQDQFFLFASCCEYLLGSIVYDKRTTIFDNLLHFHPNRVPESRLIVTFAPMCHLRLNQLE